MRAFSLSFTLTVIPRVFLLFDQLIAVTAAASMIFFFVLFFNFFVLHRLSSLRRLCSSIQENTLKANKQKRWIHGTRWKMGEREPKCSAKIFWVFSSWNFPGGDTGGQRKWKIQLKDSLNNKIFCQIRMLWEKYVYFLGTTNDNFWR